MTTNPPEESVSEKLTRLTVDVKSKFNKEPKIIDVLDKSFTLCEKMIPSLDKYDVDAQHKANGYRSILSQYASLLQYSLASCTDDHIDQLVPLLEFYSLNLTRCHRWMTSDAQTDSRRHFIISLEEVLSGLQDYYKCADKSALFLSQIGANYNLSPRGARLGNLFRLLLVFTQSKSSCNKVKSLFSERYRIKFLRSFYDRPSLDQVVDFVSLTETVWMKHLYPYLAFRSYPYTLQKVTLPYNRPFVIFHDEGQKQFRIQRNTSSDTVEDDRVQCYIYRSTTAPDDHHEAYAETVLIYMHGGGFVLNPIEITKQFLPSLTSKLSGITVIAVHYDAAPRKRFPRAPQQLLDATLFFTSNSHQVKSILGFKPKQFILAGDSSGAVNAMSVLVALNEINQLEQSKTHQVPLPIAFLAVYPLFYIGPMICASSITGFKDVVLFPTFAAQSAFAQLPDLKDGTSFRQVNHPDPWFTKSHDELFPTFEAFRYIIDSPFFSPYRYDKWSQVAPKVDLIIFALHDDVLLDFSLSIVPIWKQSGGQVHLDVVDKLKHACFYFMAIAKTFFKPLFESIDEAENLIVQRVKTVAREKYDQSKHL